MDMASTPGLTEIDMRGNGTSSWNMGLGVKFSQMVMSTQVNIKKGYPTALVSIDGQMTVFT